MNEKLSAPLRKLLGPTSKNVLEGRLFRSAEDLSMRIITQDAFGWQRWMKENGLGVEDSPEDIIIQAGRKIGWSEDAVKGYLLNPSLQLDRAIPACVYKGNQENGRGDISAWAHLFNLDPSFASACPPHIKPDVAKHIDEYRELYPKVKSEPNSSKDLSSSSVPLVKPSDKWKSETVEVVLDPCDSYSRNKTFALLGREIVQHKGITKQGERKAESYRASYRISISLASNTMRIYDLKRSGEHPILVDENGQIDHASAQVLSKDVECFQSVVEAIHQEQSQSHSRIPQEIEL